MSNQELTSQASTLNCPPSSTSNAGPNMSKNSSLTSDTYPASSSNATNRSSSTTTTSNPGDSQMLSNHRSSSSLVNAIRRFAKNNMYNDDLNTLIIQYIAKTGQLPVLSEKELDQLPKLKFGSHINTMTGFVRAGGDSMRKSTMKKPMSSPSRIDKGIDSSDMDSSDDECTVMAWKEDFMVRYNYDIDAHAKEFKTATQRILHWRRVWRAVNSVIEKRMLNAVDEYNRLYGYDRTEKARCESKNCEYLPFTAYRKQLHRLLITGFDDMPPFTVQRLCELISKTPGNAGREPLIYRNCGKYMRAIEKTLRVCSYWRPAGIFDLFDEIELPSELQSECGQSEDEDKGSVFNDTASMQSISKHSWHSKSMMSPRSCGSQSPYHNLSLENDSELNAIIRDVGPGVSAETMVRVPSPITVIKPNSSETSPVIVKEKRPSSEGIPSITKKLKTLSNINVSSECKEDNNQDDDDMLNILGQSIDEQTSMKSPKDPKPRRPSSDSMKMSSSEKEDDKKAGDGGKRSVSNSMDTVDSNVDVEEVDVESDI